MSARQYDTPGAALLASLDGIEATARKVVEEHERRDARERRSRRGVIIARAPDDVVSARWQLHFIAQVRERLASETDGDARDMAYFALRLGAEVNRNRIEDYVAKLRVAEPHIERGRKTEAAIIAGGRETAARYAAERPADDELCAAVCAIHTRNQSVSWTEACRIVGERIGKSGKTVQRYTRSVKW